MFRKDGWAFPCCGKPMRLRAVLDGPPASTRVFEALRSGLDPPPDALGEA